MFKSRYRLYHKHSYLTPNPLPINLYALKLTSRSHVEQVLSILEPFRLFYICRLRATFISSYQGWAQIWPWIWKWCHARSNVLPVLSIWEAPFSYFKPPNFPIICYIYNYHRYMTSKLEAICISDSVAEWSKVPDSQWVVKSPDSNPGRGCTIY